jgi:maltose-binding protein MalE
MAAFGRAIGKWPAFQKFFDVFTPMLESATLGVKSVEQAVAEAEAEINKVMKDYPDWPDTGPDVDAEV